MILEVSDKLIMGGSEFETYEYTYSTEYKCSTILLLLPLVKFEAFQQY